MIRRWTVLAIFVLRTHPENLWLTISLTTPSDDDETDGDSVNSKATAVPAVYSRDATASPQPQADGDDSNSGSSSSEEELLDLPEIPDPAEELDPEELEYLAAYLVRQGHATAEDALESAQSLVEESLEFEQRVMEERRRILEARADRIMEDVQHGDYSSGISGEGSSASEQEEEGGCQGCDNDPGYDDCENDDGDPADVEQEVGVDEDSDEWDPGQENSDEDSDEYVDVEDYSDEEF